VGDIDTAVVDSLKALDPNRPIREADIGQQLMLQLRGRFQPYQNTGLNRYDAGRAAVLEHQVWSQLCLDRRSPWPCGPAVLF
jgi:hypothetical protein